MLSAETNQPLTPTSVYWGLTVLQGLAKHLKRFLYLIITITLGRKHHCCLFLRFWKRGAETQGKLLQVTLRLRVSWNGNTSLSLEPTCSLFLSLRKEPWPLTRRGGSGWACLWASCYCSVAQSRPTLCDPIDWSTPGFPVHHHLPELDQTHVHWVGDAVQPSQPLSSASPPAFNLSHHQGLFSWVCCSHPMAQVLDLQL